jgi:hypothetical protein
MRHNKMKRSGERLHISVAVVTGALMALAVAAMLFNNGRGAAQSIGAVQDGASVAREGTGKMGQDADSRIKFENPAGAPLVIREVKVKTARGANPDGSSLVNVTVANTTNRRIKSFGLVFVRESKEMAYTERKEVIGANGTFSFDALTLSGNTSDLVAKIKGVRFADGSKWGDFTPPPPAPPAPGTPPAQ